MTAAQSRIRETQAYFENNDIFLAFRRLLDCVMDTQDMAVYKEAIALTDWKERHPDKNQELKERAFSLLEKIRGISIKETAVQDPILSAEGITKSYGINRFSLGPISLEIRRGQVYGLVGENGNGKTTLLRILAGELSHNAGGLRYSFREPVKDTYQLRTKLVYIPQRTQKWHGSLQDNLKFVLSSYGVNAAEITPRVLIMIARLGLWNYKDLKWHELSSGYKMRFELARTLLRQPEILLLDEPLANLDVLAQQIILEDLKYIANSINNPIALILSSQQLYEVEKVSDKVIFLKNGRYDQAQHVQEEGADQPLIVEIDTIADREVLNSSLSGLPLTKLSYNGGVYIAHFAAQVSFSDILLQLGNDKVDVIYVRNISASTRRFFIA